MYDILRIIITILTAFQLFLVLTRDSHPHHNHTKMNITIITLSALIILTSFSTNPILAIIQIGIFIQAVYMLST